jgi:putative NADH-flavin reductase
VHKPASTLTLYPPDVATELLRAPIRSGNHQITIFTRSEPPTTQAPGVTYQKVNYHDLPALTAALSGFDTVLSFLVAHLDEDNICQKNLIEACVTNKIRRFAPSEWSIASNSTVPGYLNKDAL